MVKTQLIHVPIAKQSTWCSTHFSHLSVPEAEEGATTGKHYPGDDNNRTHLKNSTRNNPKYYEGGGKGQTRIDISKRA